MNTNHTPSIPITGAEWRQCLRLAHLARDAYHWTADEPLEAPRRIDHADGELAIFRGAGAAAAILRQTNATIIALPGSLAEPHDWIANFDTRQIKIPNLGRCHFGFWVYADALWRNFLAPQLQQHPPHDQPLYITGHSQGGAVAGLIAHLLTRRGWSPRLTVSFGAPQFLHPEAARAYQPELIRFRNRGDIVPLLPRSWRRRYADCGRTIDLPARSVCSLPRSSVCRAIKSAVAFSASLLASFTKQRSQRPHSIHSYINQLEAINQRNVRSP
ncbi:MAG: lipase family protein [bacterium]|nr:lipase family protein [bacterium]